MRPLSFIILILIVVEDDEDVDTRVSVMTFIGGFKVVDDDAPVVFKEIKLLDRIFNFFETACNMLNNYLKQ